MANFKDICKKYDATILQQLYKKIVTDSGTQDKNVFPIALVQGVYDAISGMRLDDILTHYNYINIRYGGTQEATRLLIPIAHRRKLLIIAYTDYDGNSYIEQYIGETINDNDWKASDNWKTPFTKGNFMVNLTDAQLEKYINKYFETHDMSGLIQQGITINFNQFINSEEGQGLLNNVATTIIQQYVADNLSEETLANIINTYLADNIQTICNTFFNSDAGKQAINEAIAPQLEEIVGEYFTALSTFVEDNERVIANALARHEQAITDLQN